ncbi:MAG TPA: hypothetical protein VI522_04650, partial [Gammaproteobacteria bacterium]|nr:hypothetical protein [Gammaproteobacteria bacterium]
MAGRANPFLDPHHAVAGAPAGAAAPAAPAADDRGRLRRLWDGTRWFTGSTAWYATRPLAWAVQPIGDGIGAGAADGAVRTLEQRIADPQGPIATHLNRLEPEALKRTFEEALLRQPPKALFELGQL